jgi:flagellar transcriptional activator FlhD
MRTANNLNEGIREANLTFLILAKNLILENRSEAINQLNITDDVVQILECLSTAQIVRLAESNSLVCRFPFDDRVVRQILSDYTSNPRGSGADESSGKKQLVNPLNFPKRGQLT